ncbi:MAG: hypothetical protein E7067_02995 [Lentimicrobiaceae bacterium]|nr:hypothetical protein [Lentimicrobiaceae bacterium]
MKIINIVKWVRRVSKEANKNSIAIILDFLKLRRNYLVSKDEYSNYRLYEASNEFRDSYFSLANAYKVWKVINPTKYACIARDKYLSHCLLDSLNIPKSELYIYYNPQFAYNTDKLAFNYEGVVNIIKEKDIKRCVIKPSQDSAHGHGVIVCNNIEIADGKCLLKKFDGQTIELNSILGEQPLLFESFVKQSEQLASFNPSSVNTVRMMTALYPNNEVKLIASFIKIGRAGSCVDNAGAGGNVDAAIDINSGKLYNALEFNSWHNIVTITHHPDTNNPIDGVVIKDWSKIVNDLCRFQSLIPQIKIIGWDVALTENGPVIIEINNWWDTTGQLFIKRGWKKEVMDCYNAWNKHK